MVYEIMHDLNVLSYERYWYLRYGWVTRSGWIYE